MSGRAEALIFSLVGAALAVAGIALIYVPAALIVAGVLVGAFGFLLIDVDEED